MNVNILTFAGDMTHEMEFFSARIYFFPNDI